MKKKNEEYSEGFEDYFDKEKTFDKDKNIENNLVIIAGRPIEVYNQVILEKGQKYDMIIINVADKYVPRALTIIKLWEAFGLVPTKEYTRGNGLAFFAKEEKDITPRDGTKKYKEIMNKMVLLKVPEIMRFTNLQ